MGHRLREALRDVVPTIRSLIVAVIALALAGATVLSIDAATATISDELRVERVRATDAMASSVGTSMTALVTAVELGFGALAPWDPEMPPRQDRLDAMLARSLGLVAAVVIGPDRTVVAASTGREETVNFPRSGDHIDRAFAGDVAVTGVVRDLITDRDVLRIAVPIDDADGQIGAVGVATLPVATGPLLDTVASLEPDDASQIRVGLAIGDAVITPMGLDSASDPFWRAPLAGTGAEPSGALEYEPSGGVAHLATASPAARGWTIVVSQPLAEFEPPLLQRRGALAAIPGLAALLVLLAVLGVARRRRVRLLSKDAEDTKRSFLSVTGHELRTPLTVIGGMLRTINSALERGPVAPEMLSTMVDASWRNAQLLELRIERVLLVAALDAGTGAHVQARPTDLAPVVTDLLDSVEQTAPSHRFDVDVEEGLQVLADAKAVRQLLLELLDNAVRYTPGDGVIEVQVRRAGRRAELIVRDNGVGLPADDRRLFDKFHQGEEVDRRVHDEGGVGLGLYIVQTLVTAMNGRVRAERANPGSRFIVELPLA